MYIYTDVARDFSCEACGNCCRNDWDVTIDQESYRRNAELFTTLGKQAEFRQAFIPIQGRKGLGEYAAIAKKPRGGCWFLTGDNLCSLQQQAGHSHLDVVCQTFPRYPMNTARGTELTLSFICPAVLKRASRSKPLAIIRSEQAPLTFPPNAYTVDVFPEQQPLSSPLRHYFELEQHFIDILQHRKMTIAERLDLLKGTIQRITALQYDDDFSRKLTGVFEDNYDLLEAQAEPTPADSKPADVLLEHFLVNFVFKKPFYIYGLQRSLLILEHIWLYCAGVRRPAKDEAEDSELAKAAIMAVEYQYGHNRSALLKQVERP